MNWRTCRMNELSRVDLNRIQVDQDTFLGRALEAGVALDKIPPRVTESLAIYLRATATQYARRFRRGIKISKDILEEGLRRIVICMDMGLRDLSKGDLNRAVENVEPSRFEEIRRRGYEIIFERLRTMRDTSEKILGSPQSKFLLLEEDTLRGWSTITPERWTKRDPFGGEEIEVGPDTEYAEFQRIVYKASFLESLPAHLTSDLLRCAPQETEFLQVITNMVIALAIEHGNLVLRKEDIQRFKSGCFRDGKLLPEIRKRIRNALQRHLNTQGDDQIYKEYIARIVESQLEAVQESMAQGLEEIKGLNHFLLCEDEHAMNQERDIFGDPQAS
jgi:hypothetical protein